MPKTLNLMAGPQFAAELKKLTRRVNLIKAYQHGDAAVRTVRVGRVKVRAHTRKAHTRLILVRRKGK